jgi:hypothetical protein
MSARTAKKTSRKAAAKLDPATRARREVLTAMKRMTPDELFQLAVRAGIYTSGGELTAPYRDATPSATRPTD